jgi:hypothetical protein
MNANLEHLDSPGALSERLPAMTSGFVWKKGAFALGHILIVLPKAILTQVKTQRRGAGSSSSSATSSPWTRRRARPPIPAAGKRAAPHSRQFHWPALSIWLPQKMGMMGPSR